MEAADGSFRMVRKEFWAGVEPNAQLCVLRSSEWRSPVLGWVLTFLLIAIIAGALGFGGIAGTSASIAQVIFFIFLVGLVVSLAMHMMRRA